MRPALTGDALSVCLWMECSPWQSEHRGRLGDAPRHGLAVHAGFILGDYAGVACAAGVGRGGPIFGRLGVEQLVRAAMADGAIGGLIAFLRRHAVDAAGVVLGFIGVAGGALRLGGVRRMREFVVIGVTGIAAESRVGALLQLLRLVMAGRAVGLRPQRPRTGDRTGDDRRSSPEYSACVLKKRARSKETGWSL